MRARPLVSRRADGLVEIRPRRLRSVFIAPDAGVLLLLLVGCGVFLATLCVGLLEAPLFVGFVGLCLVLGLISVRLTSSDRLSPAPVRDPPPRRAA
jgi:hypothetical protein